MTLPDYLSTKLMGSSLKVNSNSKSELRIDADHLLTINVRIGPKKKIEYTIFSKLVNRPITVEEINGAELMEPRFEAELEKEDKLAIAQDTLISLDLLREWAKENDYSIAFT